MNKQKKEEKSLPDPGKFAVEYAKEEYHELMQV